MIAQNPAAADGPQNPGFESGNLLGWVAPGFPIITDLGTRIIETAQVVTEYVPPAFTPIEGNYFGVVTAEGEDVWSTLTTRSFFARAGQKLSGYTFFQTDDLLTVSSDGEAINDRGEVAVRSGGNDLLVVFSKTVAEIGSFNRTDWTRWEYTIPADGFYEVQARVMNTGDDALPSSVGLDALMLDALAGFNRAPVLNLIGSKSVDEGSTLRFTALALDFDVQDAVFYSLANAPAGASIDPVTGDFTWTPTEAQGPGSYDILVIARDNGSPVLSDAEAVTVTVNEVNQAPAFSPVSGQTLIPATEGEPLAFPISASDADLPANALTYSLVNAPAGASVDPTTGVFTWTPAEGQGPGTYNFTARATDGGNPALVAEKPISIQVAEVNQAPVLAPIGSKTVDEETPLAFTASASDADLPANTLTYSLVNAPIGASINPATGAFTWTPTEAQGSSAFSFTVRVTDSGTPAFSSEERIAVSVRDVNKAPVLDPIGNQTVRANKNLSFTASASDTDLPANTLTYSLVGAPSGASINATTGKFSWTPTAAQGGNHSFTVRVTDNGNPALSDEERITVAVNANNHSPQLGALSKQTVDEGTPLSFTATATDADAGTVLTFSLQGDVPEGARIDPATGVFSWTPTEAQGPDSYTFTIAVADDGLPALSDTKKITVKVTEVNQAPVLDPIGDKVALWGTALVFTVTASDPDLPANGLTYSLVDAPQGARIHKNTGRFFFQAPPAATLYTFKVVVTDGGKPALSDEEQITLRVTPRISRLQYEGALQTQTSDAAALKARLLDESGAGVAGETITFRLGTQTKTAVTDSSGVAATTIVVSEAPGSLTASAVFAGSSLFFGSTDASFQSFQVLPEDARVGPETLLAATDSADAGVTPITLRSVIQDITAVRGDPAYDAFAGNIINARATFIDRGTGAVIAGDVPVVGSVDGATTVGTASATQTVDIGQSAGQTYTVGVRVAGHYTRDSAYDNTLVTVFRPQSDLLVGDGYLINGNSSGLYAGDRGEKTHFGLAVKFNSAQNTWSGQATLLIRSEGRIYEVRTSSIASLSVRRSRRQSRAAFDGTASLWDITNPQAPTLVDSDALFALSLADGGDGGNDTLGVTLQRRSDGAIYFSSRGNGLTISEQSLDGGDVQVR